MPNLLLITDVPRLRKLFVRLAEDRNLSLRVAGSLEHGDEELVANRPAMVFVQTHLSGLSADILLMHFKKLLGRRRTRFVLLSPADQVNNDAIKLYHHHIDSSLDDQSLNDAIMTAIATLAPKGKRAGASQGDAAPNAASAASRETPDTPAERGASEPPGGTFDAELPFAAPVQAGEPGGDTPLETAEPSLEQQGVVYAPRPQLSVYSEFTSTFDSAVSQAPEPEPAERLLDEAPEAWSHAPDTSFRAEQTRTRSKSIRYVLWLVAIIVASVAVTLYQYQGSRSNPSEPARPPAASAGPEATAPPVSSAPKPQADEAQVRLGDRAVITAIAENRAGKEQKPVLPSVARPTALPEFIPRGGLDKGYGAANPGWELYRGVVTEFKVFREGAAIKAIQVIDRGGQGIPETFMKGVLGHLARSQTFSLTSSEKKEGYEIQRGQVAGNLGAVLYRDVQGGKLRAFVLTWQ